jgi:CRISPR/Cas system CSM-associated protein Csm4 (group 5 of RAMP superfamily)
MKVVLRGKFMELSNSIKKLEKFSYKQFKSTPKITREKKKQINQRGVECRK